MIDEPNSTSDALTSVVRAAAPSSFEPGFENRVLSRVRAERESAVSIALERQFRRVVPVLAAATLVMAAFNFWRARGTDSSPIEAALNLPKVSIATAYAAPSYDASGVPELP